MTSLSPDVQDFLSNLLKSTIPVSTAPVKKVRSEVTKKGLPRKPFVFTEKRKAAFAKATEKLKARRELKKKEAQHATETATEPVFQSELQV